MFGAIFLQEMLTGGRRRKAYFLRWIIAAILLVQLGPRLLMGLWYELERPGSSSLAVYAEFFDRTYAEQHFLILLILTPALAAGAITDEKVRGTLDYLLTTCLHPVEIVLGKLFARAGQVFTMALITLPLVCFFGVIVDMPVANIAALVVASAVVVTATAALSLLASVWCPRTRDAVLVTYLVLFTGYCTAEALSAAGWDGLSTAWSLPDAVSRDSDSPVELRLLALASGWLLPGGVCVALAAWRLRPAYEKLRRGARATARAGSVRGQLPALREYDNPVSWRERCVHGIAPLARLRAIPLRYAVPAFGFFSGATMLALVAIFLSGQADLAGEFADRGLAGFQLALRVGGVNPWTVGSIHAGITFFALSLLLIVRASGVITDEREHGSWDTLLLTPLTTQEIVRGKFWGLLRAFLPYVVAYALATLPLALLIGAAAYVAITLAAGLLLVTAPFIVAVGLYCSAIFSSSWRSLLATLAAFYAYLILAVTQGIPACYFGVIVGLIASFMQPLLEDMLPDVGVLVGGVAGVVAALVLNALVILPLSWAMVQWTETRINRVERARVSRTDQKKQKLLQIADDLERERERT